MHIIFDFDGTLADTSPGIMSCLEETFLETGTPIPENLERFIGPPLIPAMMDICGVDQETAESMLKVYRAHYGDHGMYNAELYDGIRDMLTALKEKGHNLYIGTSKPEHFARKIIEALGITEFFTEISGTLKDVKHNSKAAVLAELFCRVGVSPDDKTFADSWCMVGDRIYDAEGAAAFGIPCVGVLWGFGSAEEFEGCTVVNTPAELVERF